MANPQKGKPESSQTNIDLEKRLRELTAREITLEASVTTHEHEKLLLNDSKKQFNDERQSYREGVRAENERLARERAELNNQALEIARLQGEARAGFPDMTMEWANIEAEKAKLVKREQAIIKAEQKRDAGFSDERAALETVLQEKRVNMESKIDEVREQKLSALEDEIGKLKTKRLDDITKFEQSERDRFRTVIFYEREAWTKQQEDARKLLEVEWTEFNKQKGALSALQSEHEGRKTELEANERTLERKEQRLEQQWQRKNNQLDDIIVARLEEERKSLEADKQSFKEENASLRESIRIQTELVGAFDHLKRQLGDRDPAEILLELNSKTNELKRMREELATRPTEEMRQRYEVIEAESRRQQARISQLEQQINDNASAMKETNDLRRKNSELEADNKSLNQRASRYEASANEVKAELDRLRAAYQSPVGLEERRSLIEIPHVTVGKLQQAKKFKDGKLNELSWLENIGKVCDEYGIHFPPRILKAFHTALKTAEWSPLTILAGVSGTGKSELPRLYSHFGGLIFEPVSVQPNWDSQESMLGFFNSIDNKFDAQPILRFLAQSQKPWSINADNQEGYPGLNDAVCLVMLDELNLAHPELYFAEFLSKLEFRRGMKGLDVPHLPVKLGAGMPAYELPLGRNVLWTGTMNQDETTKSLSDKVLDRSIVIHFPRPTVLRRRLKLTPLDEKNRGTLLHIEDWRSWLVKEVTFESPEVIRPFKGFIEQINNYLGVVGRALGHRVWQSIEYYMASYPDVRLAQVSADKGVLNSALHTAFEDQLVQKVMPKLRGIDTRGNSKTDCLDKISTLLNTGVAGRPFDLRDDFKLACELGYGQFIWQSANFIKDEPDSDVSNTTPPDQTKKDK